MGAEEGDTGKVVKRLKRSAINLLAPSASAIWCVPVSILVYIACLFCPAFCEADACYTGLAALKGGALAILLSHANDSWFANLLLSIAWISGCFAQRLWMAAFGVLALCIAGSLLLTQTVMHNEGGVLEHVVSFQAGYWLWLTSMAICCAPLVVGGKPDHLAS